MNKNKYSNIDSFVDTLTWVWILFEETYAIALLNGFVYKFKL